MKKKQVLKLFSFSMACILAMSPCGTAGSIAYASEVQQEGETDADTRTGASNEGEDAGDSSSNEGEDESAEKPSSSEDENTKKPSSSEDESAEKPSSSESVDVEDSSSKEGEDESAEKPSSSEDENAESPSSSEDESTEKPSSSEGVDIEDSSSKEGEDESAEKSSSSEDESAEDPSSPNESESAEDPSSNEGETEEDASSSEGVDREDKSEVNTQEPSQDIKEEETTEEVTEEITLEEETEEITEEATVFAASVEDVALKTFYDGAEISFDQSGEDADWSDKGEHQLKLKSEKPLKSGATVSFDMYIPAEKADYSGKIKVQGIARLGDKWTWTENKTIPEFGTSDFIEEVIIGDETYKKVKVSFTFGDEITTDYLAEFTVKIVGWQCTYEGPIKYANVELVDGENDTNAGEAEPVDWKSFYDGAEISFDQSGEDADWSDKGEHQLKLKSEKPLKSGAAVSFDMYIPAGKADYSGKIKVQGIARLGDKWTWTDNKTIPEFGASDFTEEVIIGDETYKKVKVSFTFGNEITADYLAEFTVKIVGYQCTYKGPIYYANVKLVDGTSQPEQTEEKILKTWDFAENIDGWKLEKSYQNDGDNSLEWSEKYQALAMNVDYSQNVAVNWSEIKASYWNDDFEAAGANTIDFDFIYDPSAMSKGSFKIKLSSDKINADTTVNTDTAEDYADGLKVVHFTMNFDDVDIAQGITIGIIGCETDYKGVIYLDNITLRTAGTQQVEDIYVDATEEVTGQDMQLSVQGNTLSTGAGSTSIATDITFVDGNATDSAKQIYAYLQAVGNTDSVIFGQQNNTSHKAGSSDLSCSDTMDVVGSYAGVIGLDGLSLTGNEYSAERYLDEMKEDGAYSSVSNRIASAATDIEKNVIAAAALTNYNIRNGAIATLSLHMPNFSVVKQTGITDGPSYAAYDFSGYTPNTLTGDVINQILPGGAYNSAFTAYLDMVADYAHQVDGAVLFRPFHENTGSWFWWGAAFCDAQTYKSVYKYTVEYLRDEKGVHNFLYVYGPGSEASSVEEYAARYPGDGYVDMVGFDMYHRNPTAGDSFVTNFANELNIVERFAKEHNKLVAVTETGTAHDVVEGDDQTALLKQGNERRDWYREILDVVKGSSASYYLVWANFSEKDGFYTPYVKSVKEDKTKHGHEMMDDFIRFFNEDSSVFAVNQQSALNEVKSLSVHANAAISKSGYVVVPVSGSRVLDETTLRAKVTGVSSADQVTFVCKGSNVSLTLEAQVADGYATAVLSPSDLQSLGKTVGEISLIINGETFDTTRAMFNIGEPEADPYEIDGFENYYGVDDMLTKSWAPNKDTGCTLNLSLSKDYSYEGDYVMKFEYTETSNGWAGATISKEVDWTDCDALKFWTVPDGKLQKTVIQITAGGNTYEYYMNQNEDYAQMGTTPILVTIPFDKFVARDIAGNPAGGLVNDRAKITSVGLWINAIADSDAIEDGMVSGVLYYDNITAVASGSSEVLIQKVESKPTEPEQPSEPEQPTEPEQPSEPEQPTEPEQPEESSSSSSSSSSNNNSASAPAAPRVVAPSYTTKDNRKVNGWQEVVDAAYLDAQPTVDTVSGKRIADINITGVTDLIIPRATVVTMQQKMVDYNFYYQNIAITISHEMLTGWTKELDLGVVLKSEEDFGEGFDAFYVTKYENKAFPESAVINVLLSTNKAGSYAHIFGRNRETAYELVSTVPISELGTVTIPAAGYEAYIILY